MVESQPNRWVIKGELTLRSPLALRTGREEEDDATGGDLAPAGAVKLPASNDRDAAGVLAICLDHEGKPVIPGSSLKGVLRGYTAARGDPNLVKSVFGDYAREPKANDPLRGFLYQNPALRDAKVSVGGKAEFCEARIAGHLSDEQKRKDVGDHPYVGRTAIDPETRTAAAGLLRHERIVAAGTRFAVEIVADRISRNEIDLLLAALWGFNDAFPITIGSGRGGGYGRASWELTELHEIDTARIAAWLAEKTPRHWRALLAEDSAKRQAKRAAKDAVAKIPEDPIPRVRIALSIAFTTPFLVGDPARAKEAQGQQQGPNLQARLTIDQNGMPTEYVPASSVRGVLSAQAARIVRTLEPELDARERPPDCVRLFGSTVYAGAVTVSDFLPRWRPKQETQEFVAIDRFTGGAAHGFKFQAEPMVAAGDDDRSDPVFFGHIDIRLRAPTAKDSYIDATGKRLGGDTAPDLNLTNAGLGLLALLARDLLEGDLTFGHGASKGYGVNQTTIAEITLNASARRRLSEDLGLDPGDRIDGVQATRLLKNAGVRAALQQWVDELRNGGLAEHV